MNILIASSIDPVAIDRLREQHDVVCAFGADLETLRRLIHDRDILVFRSGVTISAEVMAAAPNLKLLVRAGSGCDNIDLGYVEQKELQLIRVPEPGAKAVAELAFTQMLVLARETLRADRSLRQGQWIKGDVTGYLLTGKVLGIVGAGNIGSRVGHLGSAWGMEAIGCVDDPSPEVEESLRKSGVTLTDFHDVLARADFLSIHVPLQDSTRHLIDADALARMKPGSFLVNTARGGIVDENALRTELTTPGRLSGAALDVHQNEGSGKISPLADLPNVLLTPHIGASTVDTQREIGLRVLDIVHSHCATQTPMAPVPAVRDGDLQQTDTKCV